MKCPECNSKLERIGYYYGITIKWGCPNCDAIFQRSKDWETGKIETTRLKYFKEGWNKYYSYSQFKNRGQ